MDDTVVVLMLKNEQTGYLETELGTYTISGNAEFLEYIFAEYKDDVLYVHVIVSYTGELLDWEFNAVYDYYDANVYSNVSEYTAEAEGCYNPAWEIVFKFIDNQNAMEEKLLNILKIHKDELDDVFLTIKDKRNEYSNISEDQQ